MKVFNLYDNDDWKLQKYVTSGRLYFRKKTQVILSAKYYN